MGGAADAIRYLVDHGVRVINISGVLSRHLTQPVSESSWRKLEEAVAYAIEKDIVIVLAAGNNAQRWDDYPGTAETVIVAGAAKLDDTPWFQEDMLHGTKIRQGSNSGKRLTAMAPVQDLVVRIPHETALLSERRRTHGPQQGPLQRNARRAADRGHLNGGADRRGARGLGRSAGRDLDVRAVVAIVQRGCDDIGAPGFDKETGHGRVNFGKTLHLARAGGFQP